LKKLILSIIIPTHNSDQTIERCIRSLTSQSFPREKFEIIVVDDGSKDQTASLAKKAGADKVIITEPCFQGKARNIGVENAKADFLAFIDSDCKAKDGWINYIIEELKNLHVVGGPVLNGNPQSLTAWGEYFVEFCAFHEFRKRSIIRTIPSCNIACTKDAFFKAGGFFTDVWLSEDTLFAEHLREAGVEEFFVPEIKILHFCRTKLSKVLSNHKYLGRVFVRNLEYIPIAKSRLRKQSRWVIPIIFIGKIVKSANYAVKARKFCKFILAFHIVFLANISFARGFWDEIGNFKTKSQICN